MKRCDKRHVGRRYDYAGWDGIGKEREAWKIISVGPLSLLLFSTSL